MTSKRFKGKDCAYCGGKGISSTADHVVAGGFFLEADRANLPQVPACKKCNGGKSELEAYAAATLMAGSNLEKGDLYRQQLVRPRLSRNLRLQREVGMHRPPVLMDVNGIIQPMHRLTLEPAKIDRLMGLIATGLYHHHLGKPLSNQYQPDVKMVHPEHEPRMWADLSDWFPPSARRFGGDLGRSSFIYEGAQSPAAAAFTVWRMSWHNGIRLHGAGTPPEGVGVWWVITRPTVEALEAAAQSDGTHAVLPDQLEGPEDA